LLLLDPFGLQQRSGVLLNHRPAFIEERITAIRGRKPGGMRFHLITYAAEDRTFMAIGAGISIEQRPEAIRRPEHSLEHFFALLELGALLGGQISQRLTKGRLLLRLTPAQHETDQQRIK
jgi:hypothetical protein